MRWNYILRHRQQDRAIDLPGVAEYLQIADIFTASLTLSVPGNATVAGVHRPSRRIASMVTSKKGGQPVLSRRIILGYSS
jgi:hypothetical protein